MPGHHGACCQPIKLPHPQPAKGRNTMKLRQISTKDTAESVSYRFRRSTVSLIEAYRVYYQKTYGDEIKSAPLVEEIVRNFIESDKDFAKSQIKKG